MRLSDDELRDVLTRAEEIQRTSRSADSMQAEMEAVIGAGEAVGLTRPALEQALRERLELSVAPPVPGSLVFAQSADGKYYVADVLSVSNDAIRVRYVRGSEHMVTPEQVRPCAFLPGERVTVNWPWWGPWTCTVVSFDAARKKVRLTDGWGSTQWFLTSEVWITPKVPSRNRVRMSVMLMGAGAAIGALIGSIVTGLLLP